MRFHGQRYLGRIVSFLNGARMLPTPTVALVLQAQNPRFIWVLTEHEKLIVSAYALSMWFRDNIAHLEARRVLM